MKKNFFKFRKNTGAIPKLKENIFKIDKSTHPSLAKQQ